MKRELRKWRKEEADGAGYRGIKKEYKEMCDRKKEKERERWEKEVEEARTEGQVVNSR